MIQLRSPRSIRVAVVSGLVNLLTMVSPALAESAGGYRQLGLTYRQQGQLNEAIASFRQAVELEPNNLSGRVLLGWTLHLAGEGQEAQETLMQTVYLDPFHIPTLNALGIVYLVNDHLIAAALTHSWAVTLNPENEIGYYNLSLACQRLQQYEWAIATAAEAARLEPANPHPFVAWAIAHAGNDDLSAAQQAYGQALSIDGRYGSLEFLDHLDEAGFSPDQITLSKQILGTLNGALN